MVDTNTETKLIQEYEVLRQRENDVIAELLDVLPKIDNLPEERIAQVRDALFHADHPFLMVFVGPFSSGKSSLINALLGTQDLLKIGPTPTTDRISILRWGEEPQDMSSPGDVTTVFYPSPLLRKVSFVDTPGLESIFQRHEEVTANFLHRSDVVLLVMLATQAMTQSNLKYLQEFKAYGKKIIIVINQADLLTEEERKTVHDYVLNQSKDKLGFEPTIWMVSARQALEARADGQFNEALWQSSGMGQFEAYIDKRLGDGERLRQKLQTPLQIAQNVYQQAVDVIRRNQATFDQYRNITENIDQQVAAQQRQLNKTVREINTEIEARFMATADQSGVALRDIFRFGRALPSFGGGLIELMGVGRLLRRRDKPSLTQQMFAQHKVFEPLSEIPGVADKLAPRLEGQDMQDIDDLVKYGQRELKSLPVTMQEKVIGAIQAPVRYDRSHLINMRPELDAILDEARVIETEQVEMARRTTLIGLALWQLIVVVLFILLVSVWGTIEPQSTAFIVLVILFSLGLLGFVFMPLRGRMIHTAYTNRLLKLRQRYLDVVTRASDQQIEYAMRLRREAIAPLTRLVEAQALIQDQQMTALKTSEQSIARLESEINALGKRSFLGLKL